MQYHITDWTPILGRWTFQEHEAIYEGPDSETKHPHGIAAARPRMSEGKVRVSVNMAENVAPGVASTSGKILLGYRAVDQVYYTAGLGGYRNAYSVSHFIPDDGWNGISVVGSEKLVVPNRWYDVEVVIQGDHLRLKVDDVSVLELNLPASLSLGHVGLHSWGYAPVRYRDFVVEPKRGEVFVAMEFGPEYERVYEAVIRPAVIEAGLTPYHGGQILGPGRITDEVARRIRSARAVIAEITSLNPNVFYELGYAHAFGVPTLLVAENRAERIPFDVSDYRCVYYDKTDAGWANLRETVTGHIQSILEA